MRKGRFVAEAGAMLAVLLLMLPGASPTGSPAPGGHPWVAEAAPRTTPGGLRDPAGTPSASVGAENADGGALLGPLVRPADGSQRSADAPKSRCPAPTTCAAYGLNKWRWPLDRGGTAVVPFWLNPDGQPWFLDDGEVEKAVLAAAGAWMAADPTFRLVYKGKTGDGPGDDSKSVISWEIGSPDRIAVANVYHKGNRISNADITLNPTYPWDWTPCAQRDGSCTPVSYDLVNYLDLQSVVTHEFGHWLSLKDLESSDAGEMTMFSAAENPGERKQSTLGLGDILGARAAYPCRCARPRVYTP